MRNERIILIAPLPAIKKRTRLAKIAPVIRSRGLEIGFLGWEREKGEAARLRSDDPGIGEKIILRGGGYATTRAHLMYPIWMMIVFFRTLMIPRTPVLICLGWETAFPARLAAFFSGAQIVFDDADRFSMIIKLPGFAHKALEALEQWTSRNVALHLVPGFSRYEWRHPRMWELRNSPVLTDIEDAESNPPKRPATKLVIYANGWIGETRGAPVFLRALDIIKARGLDISMVIAGRVTGPNAERLVQHELVKFLGEVSQREALAWYGVSDLLLTYYDPSVAINRKAESNKWGDAICFGTPFIVNNEVQTAADFIAKGAAWAVPYNQASDLVDLLERLLRDPALLREASKSIKLFQKDYPVFDERIGQVLEFIQHNRENK